MADLLLVQAALGAERERQGLRQAEVARRMGTTQSQVSEVERGFFDSRVSTLIRYAEAVGGRIEIVFHPAEGPPVLGALGSMLEVPRG